MQDYVLHPEATPPLPSSSSSSTTSLLHVPKGTAAVGGGGGGGDRVGVGGHQREPYLDVPLHVVLQWDNATRQRLFLEAFVLTGSSDGQLLQVMMSLGGIN